MVVPTGNFGNILAGWMAKEIGVPLGQLICASMKIRYLQIFSKQACMTSIAKFYLTESPSMDILISSNFERFLYYVLGSADKVAAAMKALNKEGAICGIGRRISRRSW